MVSDGVIEAGIASDFHFYLVHVAHFHEKKRFLVVNNEVELLISAAFAR